MAIDSKQKRMSAIMPGLAFRGPLVDAAEVGFTQGNRQAAVYMYSGVLAGAAAEESRELFDRGNLRGIGSGMFSGGF